MLRVFTGISVGEYRKHCREVRRARLEACDREILDAIAVFAGSLQVALIQQRAQPGN